MTVATHVRSVAVSELRRMGQMRDGVVPKWFVRQLASDVGVSVSTMYRWLQDERGDGGAARTPRVHPEALTDEQVAVVFQFVGALKKAKAYLDERDPQVAAMSYATFRRLWLRQPPGIRAAASDGISAAMAAQVKMLYTPKERNEVWHVDQQELPIWVMPRGRTVTPVKPWLTTVIDGSTRRIMSVVLHVERGNSATTTAALADAMRRRPLSREGQWAGGVPAMVYSDNGGEFTSGHVKAALVSLGVAHKRSMPYMKHLNGKAERVQGTMQADLIATLPGFTNGPRSLSGKDLFGAQAQLLSEEELTLRVLGWVDAYNSEHPHSSLGGLTPNEAWCSQQGELREADPEAIRLAMMRRDRDYKVQPTGVFFNGRYYMSPEFAHRGLVGRKVTVRYMPGDESMIEVFLGEEWVGTAVPHQDLSPHQRSEMDRQRRAELWEARRLMDAAAAAREADAYGGDGSVIVERSVDSPHLLGPVDRSEVSDLGVPDAGVAGNDLDDPFADLIPDLGL